MARTALVIGGGLIGVSTAWYLAERGVEVTLLERREATALETSFANGGLITPSQSDPWNGPGTLTHLLAWLGREDSPLLLRPRALPDMWRWGLKFLLASRAAPWWRATEANLRLGLYSAACLAALRQQLDLSYDSLDVGTLKLFREGDALEKSIALASSLSRAGLVYRALSPGEAVELEPHLAPAQAELAGAIHYPLDASGDAHAYTRELERRTRKAGVRFLFGIGLERFEQGGGRIATALTTAGPLSADSYVVAAGNGSPALVAPLGLSLPMYPVKGYSVTIAMRDWRHPLGMPLVDFERKTVLTPLRGRLRVAGTAEFNGFDTAPNPERSGNLLRNAFTLVPELGAEAARGEVEHWAGLRPMTSDGPPILGATPIANLYLNTGHGPLGWTLGAGSARVVADLVTGRRPEIDLTGLEYSRYGA